MGKAENVRSSRFFKVVLDFSTGVLDTTRWGVPSPPALPQLIRPWNWSKTNYWWQVMNIIMTIASHHSSFQAWPNSTNKNNWMMIKSNPPIKPKYIHAEKSKHFGVFNNKARYDNWLIFKLNLIPIGNSYCWQICHFPPRMTSHIG
jgi:hypothetical protein